MIHGYGKENGKRCFWGGAGKWISVEQWEGQLEEGEVRTERAQIR